MWGTWAGILGRRGWQRQGIAWDRQEGDLLILKLTERSWNVYENKGRLWKTPHEA
jgi:hypothetical protein